jgi:hypothetical protein
VSAGACRLQVSGAKKDFKKKDKMITFLTIPKAFNGHFNIIQRNAIKSWKLLPIESEIILFGNDAGTAEVAQEFEAKHIKECETTSHGTPRIDYLFLKGQELASNNLVCYINTDIILTSDFVIAINKLIEYKKDFLVIGQRLDYEIKEPLSLGTDWEKNIIENAEMFGRWYGPRGIDYFIFRKGFWKNIPPFAVGRTVWDNWLIYEARRQKANVIDATKCIYAIHQNHDYSHAMGGTFGAWKGEEAKRNLELADGYRYCFTIQDSSHIMLNNNRIIPKILTWHLWRKLLVWIILHPKLLSFIDRFWKRKKMNINLDR